MHYLKNPETKIPVMMETEVIVVGGGPAGLGAGIRAAKSGAKTVVVERFGSLGGMMTNGLMCIGVGDPLGGLHTELFERLKIGALVEDLLEKYPGIGSNPLFHYHGPNIMPGRQTSSRFMAFDPEMAAIVMNEMMEENHVRLLLRTFFADVVVEEDTIKAVIVENATGRQAIRGKIIIDATGRGDVVARAGAPFKSAGNEDAHPVPPGLMWMMSHVNYERLFAYQKEDPDLQKIMEQAEKKGELPHYRPKKMDIYGGAYTGHPRLEMSPALYPGDMLLWAPAVHEWGLDCAESAEDLTRGEIEIRKHILSEANFLKKYVPGFEKSHISRIAPLLGIREGRHPEGEYFMRYQDIKNQVKFEDVALKRRSLDWGEPKQGTRLLSFDIPYRCFLAKKLNNL
ncbi:MAG: FAD-dependent oxidoreductase, partial [Pseudomonadota bacterium]